MNIHSPAPKVPLDCDDMHEWPLAKLPASLIVPIMVFPDGAPGWFSDPTPDPSEAADMLCNNSDWHAIRFVRLSIDAHTQRIESAEDVTEDMRRRVAEEVRSDL